MDSAQAWDIVLDHERVVYGAVAYAMSTVPVVGWMDIGDLNNAALMKAHYAVLHGDLERGTTRGLIWVAAYRGCFDELREQRRGLARNVKKGQDTWPLGDEILRQKAVDGFEDEVVNLVDVEGLVRRLDGRERDVIRLHYLEDLPLREIGERFGVTESRVSQVHTKALRRLREEVHA